MCYKCKNKYLTKNKTENLLAAQCPDIILDSDDNTETDMQSLKFAIPDCDDMEQIKG